MSSLETLTPEQCVDLIVSGNFTASALGPGYQFVLDRVRADPARYLAIFERKFLGPGQGGSALVTLNPEHFLRLIRGQLPERVARVARQLTRGARAFAHQQVRDIAAVESVAEQDELLRQRRLLASRHAAFKDLAGVK
ncbi:hypothetical protein [Sphingomonas sp. TREG-RG-20F-R18-01]|uniref:hypothetical protein n=1 Tax=Sphingomonas sp. TREG-RG-20F-R18-01 TaxID=2914982 RepID=UPI001F592A23|nr:hypothetical protein [Sphingomonas sp. TREG-RG-20F-R18-01]